MLKKHTSTEQQVASTTLPTAQINARLTEPLHSKAATRVPQKSPAAARLKKRISSASKQRAENEAALAYSSAQLPPSTNSPTSMSTTTATGTTDAHTSSVNDMATHHHQSDGVVSFETSTKSLSYVPSPSPNMHHAVVVVNNNGDVAEHGDTIAVDTSAAGKAAQALTDELRQVLAHAIELSSVDTGDDDISAASLLKNVVTLREKIVGKVETAVEMATKATLETLALKNKLTKQDKELTTLRQEYAEATDVSFAADARIGELFRQQKALRVQAEEQQMEFDRRMLEVEHGMSTGLSVVGASSSTGAPKTVASSLGSGGATNSSTAQSIILTQKRLEQYRSEDIRRLEEEVRGLRSRLQKQEKVILERQVIQERLHRMLEDNNRQGIVVKDLETKNEQLTTDVRSLLAKLQSQKEMFDTERNHLQKQLKDQLEKEEFSRRSTGTNSPQNQSGTVAAAPSGLFPSVSDSSRALSPVQSRALAVVAASEKRDAEMSLVVYGKKKKSGVSEKQKEAITEALQHQNERHLLSRFYAMWRVQHVLRFAGEVHSHNLNLQRETITTREVKTRKLVTEKKEFAERNSELHARVDTQHKHIERLSQDYGVLQERFDVIQEKLKAYEVRETESGETGMTSEELQVAALEAYNLLFPVLQGVKTRLKIQTLDVKPLRVVKSSNTTDHIAALVVHWINENCSFLHNVLCLDDRLAKVNVKISFLSVQVRTKIKRAGERERLCHDVQRKVVLRRQIDGYVDILDSARSLASHIRSTRESLFVSVDPAKQKELHTITSTFEADVEGFYRKLKRNESLQFQFALELTTMDNNRIDQIRNKIEDQAAASIKRRDETLLKRGDSASMKSREGSSPSSRRSKKKKALHGSATPSSTTPPPDPELTPHHHQGGARSSSPSSAKSRMLLAPIPHSQQLLQSHPDHPAQLKSDPFEGRNHHSFFVNALLRSDANGKIHHKDLQKLMQEEQANQNRRRQIAIAPEMEQHQKKLKQAAKKREAELKDRAKQKELHGGLQHFAAHCGAVIPFRSNSVRSSSRMSLPKSDETESSGLVNKLLGGVGEKF